MTKGKTKNAPKPVAAKHPNRIQVSPNTELGKAGWSEEKIKAFNNWKPEHEKHHNNVAVKKFSSVEEILRFLSDEYQDKFATDIINDMKEMELTIGKPSPTLKDVQESMKGTDIPKAADPKRIPHLINTIHELVMENYYLNTDVILMKDNIPYQSFCDSGYFRVIEQKYNTPNGEVHINTKTVVYQKGVEYIRKIVASNQS